jgi:hypothetical protein
MNIEIQANLCCHDATPCEEVRAIRVIVRRTLLELELGFRLDGDIAHICLAPRGLTELWRHTCFEAFVAIDGQASYHEFNLAPSHEWQIYAFRAYRDLIPLVCSSSSPIVATNSTANRLELDARIALTGLSAMHAHSSLRLGLSAVIESRNRFLSFWVLSHPAAKPDFHNAAAFALRLEAPEP